MSYLFTLLTDLFLVIGDVLATVHFFSSPPLTGDRAPPKATTSSRLVVFEDVTNAYRVGAFTNNFPLLQRIGMS